MDRPPQLNELVAEFLQYLKTEKSASPHTLLNYEIDLRHWLAFSVQNTIGPCGLPRLTELDFLREFLSSEMERYERTTVARRLSVIKGFFKYLHREGYL